MRYWLRLEAPLSSGLYRSTGFNVEYVSFVLGEWIVTDFTIERLIEWRLTQVSVEYIIEHGFLDDTDYRLAVLCAII